MNAETEMRFEAAQDRENELERKLEDMTVELGELRDDFARYCEIQDGLKGLRVKWGGHALDQPIYQSLWRESETIKNRHGGMPPTK